MRILVHILRFQTPGRHLVIHIRRSFPSIPALTFRFVPQDIPDSRVFEHRLTCQELHPGLCATAHAAIYEDALALAKSLENVLDGDHLHKFIEVFHPGDEDAEPVRYYFARRRGRRLHHQ
eukprot:10441589-Karenia_brevis.AAC.1